MDWASDSLYNKAKMFAQRAHNEPVNSALFAFWMSLSLELLARSALSHIHPVLLADPKEPDNLQYAFGIEPKGIPKSIAAKALFARCSIFVKDFTDKMSVHCLIVADRRNSELHTGAAAFEGIDHAKWLPASYEVIQVLLVHLGRDFRDFLGDHGQVAQEIIMDRRDTIKKEVQDKLSAAKKAYEALSPEDKATRDTNGPAAIAHWMQGTKLRRECPCPACKNISVIGGETVSRSPVKIDEDDNVIRREIRVLPNKLRCPYCGLSLLSYQELKEVDLGGIYTIAEEEDPIEFFGIEPEDYIDVEDVVRRYGEDMASDYQNE
jgi:hypothetical protein